MPRLLIPGARALALLSLFALSGCSRAEKPQAQVPLPSNPSPAAEAATNAPTAVATNDASAESPALLAAAPHPTEATNNPDAVIHSPVPAPGATLHVLVPEGQNPPWLAETLGKATGAKVEVKTYAADAEAMAVTAATGEGAPDLVSLSDRAAAELVAKNALRPLGDATKGLAEPAPEFLHHYFDPKNVYVWPYGFTLLGFGTVAPTDAKAFVPRTWHDLARIDLALSLPADPQLKGALWALAEAKPAASDTPPEAWQKASYEATPALTAPGKVWVDAAPRLRAVHADRWTVTVPAEGSLIFLYHWAIPAASTQAPLAEAAFRALADPATAARLDADAGLATTHPAPKPPTPAAPGAPLPPADPLSAPAHALNESRFVREAAPAPAETVRAATPASPAK